jgi:hypothetical protein
MNKIEQDKMYIELLSAEAHYLRSCGWAPLVPVAPDAPVFWQDYATTEERSQDVAITTQKARQHDRRRANR